MILQAGDAFFAPWPDPTRNWHLYFAVSDPALNRERVLVVPLMTWDRYKETACLVDAGEHPFVRHPSCISYAYAKVVPAAFIEGKIASGEFRTHDRATPALIEKFRKGASRSRFLPLPYLYILEDQKLVEPD